MRAFRYNRNQFFEACIIYSYVNIITESEDDHFNSNKIIVLKVQRWYEQPLACLLFKLELDRTNHVYYVVAELIYGHKI